MHHDSKFRRVVKSLIIPAALIIILLIFMASTQPDKVSLPLLMVPFFLIAAVLTLTLTPIFKRLPGTGRPVVLAFVVALTPVLILLLRSINQLSVSDILFVSLFMLGVFLYVRKLSSKQS